MDKVQVNKLLTEWVDEHEEEINSGSFYRCYDAVGRSVILNNFEKSILLLYLAYIMNKQFEIVYSGTSSGYLYLFVKDFEIPIIPVSLRLGHEKPTKEEAINAIIDRWAQIIGVGIDVLTEVLKGAEYL